MPVVAKLGSGSAKRVGRSRRHSRVRKKVFGTPQRPRLVVTRSTRHMVAQIVDDVDRKTLVSASSMESELKSGDKTAQARAVGEAIGKRAKEAGIEAVVFDRGGNRYHGRVAAVADGARDAGLAL